MYFILFLPKIQFLREKIQFLLGFFFFFFVKICISAGTPFSHMGDGSCL
jgi:hypothetical protein